MKTIKCFILALSFSLILTAGYFAYLISIVPFEVTTSQIASNLEGKSVNLLYNQIWIFESSQKVSVSITATKRSEDFMFLVAEIKASAKSQDNKNVDLNGLCKITYEYIGENWHLVGLDNISLKSK